MPVYRTGPEGSLDDLVASAEARGEKIIQAVNRQGGQWVLITSLPVDDTGQPWAPRAQLTNNLGATETRA